MHCLHTTNEQAREQASKWVHFWFFVFQVSCIFDQHLRQLVAFERNTWLLKQIYCQENFADQLTNNGNDDTNTNIYIGIIIIINNNIIMLEIMITLLKAKRPRQYLPILLLPSNQSVSSSVNPPMDNKTVIWLHLLSQHFVSYKFNRTCSSTIAITLWLILSQFGVAGGTDCGAGTGDVLQLVYIVAHYLKSSDDVFFILNELKRTEIYFQVFEIFP